MTFRSMLSKRVFVDTSAFFPLIDSKDASHPVAVEVHQRLQTDGWQVFTSNFIVAETHALLLNRLNRRIALEGLSMLDRSEASGRLYIIRLEPEDESHAREIIRRYDDKDFSLVDASSFAVMERLEIPYAFTFDRHFEQYGLAVLTP